MSRYVEIEYEEFVRETANAALFVVPAEIGTEEVWIPFSQIEDGQELHKVGGVLSITRWIAEQKEIAFEDL